MSPGALPRGITVAKLSKPHKSIPVNPHLANAMHLAGYVERAGTGTEDIIDKCKQWGLLAPVWEDDGDFKVIIYREEISRETPPLANENTKIRVKTRVKINQILLDNPTSTTSQLAEVLQKTEKAIEWQLNKLKKENLIKRIGPDKGGHWEVK